MPDIFDETFTRTPPVVARRGDERWRVLAGFLPVGEVDDRLSNHQYGPASIIAGQHDNDMRLTLAHYTLGVALEFRYDGIAGAYEGGQGPEVAPGHFSVAAACLRAAHFDSAASEEAGRLIAAGQLFA